MRLGWVRRGGLLAVLTCASALTTTMLAGCIAIPPPVTQAATPTGSSAPPTESPTTPAEPVTAVGDRTAARGRYLETQISAVVTGLTTALLTRDEAGFVEPDLGALPRP